MDSQTNQTLKDRFFNFLWATQGLWFILAIVFIPGIGIGGLIMFIKYWYTHSIRYFFFAIALGILMNIICFGYKRLSKVIDQWWLNSMKEAGDRKLASLEIPKKEGRPQ